MARKKANAEEVESKVAEQGEDAVKPAASTKRTTRKKKTTNTEGTTGKTPKASRKKEEAEERAPVENTEKEEVRAEEKAPAATMMLAVPEEKLPVEAQTQRAIDVAMPPVHLGELKEQRRNFFGRLLLLLGVGIVLVLSVLIFVYRPTVYSARSHSIRFLYNAAEDTTQVIYDGELCEKVLPGAWTDSMYDTTGSICAAAVGGKLYLIETDEIEEISPTVQDFLLSQNGQVLVYRNAENQLHYVTLSGDAERHTISKDSRDSRYCLSPDGEVLFYTYVNQTADGESKTHAAVFSTSGEKPYFHETTGVIPVAISNDIEHVFYFNTDGDLYYMDKEGTVSLCRRFVQGGMELLFDREFEEVLVQDANGVMLWQNGKQTIIPQIKGAETIFLMANQRADTRRLAVGSQCLINSFDKNYYLKKGADADGARLSYLKDGELTEVAFISEQESRPVVTDKGVYYLERVDGPDGVRKHLYFCPIGETVAQRLSWDVEDFCVNSDGSHILHVDHQGWLYSSRVSGGQLDSEFISDYVDGALPDSNATDIFYYFVDGALYASDNGEKPDEAISEQIEGVMLDAHTAIFFDEREDGTYTIYTKYRNRSKLVEVATGIVSIH